MTIQALKKRLDHDRSLTTITMQIPEAMVDDLKRVAPLFGFLAISP